MKNQKLKFLIFIIQDASPSSESEANDQENVSKDQFGSSLNEEKETVSKHGEF